MTYCFSDDYVSPHRSTLTTWIQKQPASRMLVLERFDLPQDYGAVLDGWVFTCKSEILNLQALLQCSAVNGLYVSCDGTYKLTNHDWVLLNLISETIVDSHGGKCHSWAHSLLV